MGWGGWRTSGKKDAGLVHLTDLSQLTKVTLGGTKVTDAGIEKLQRALPNLEIVR